MKKIFTFFTIAFLSTISYAQTTYTWIGDASGEFSSASNWSPSRNTPANNDILVFNLGNIDNNSKAGNINVANVSTQTIGQLKINQSGALASRTLTFTGTPGTLTITGSLTIQESCILADGGYTLSVGGDIAFQKNDGSNITTSATLHSGSGKIQVTGSSSRFFNGNGTTITSGNFQFGNIEILGASANLSMTATYNAIQINGTFTINAGKFTITNATSNRTFILNSTSSSTPTGLIQCINGGVIVGGGNGSFSVTGLGPSFGNSSIGTINFDPTSATTSTLNSLSLNRSNSTLTVGSLHSNGLTIAGSVALNAGTLDDGGNTINIGGGSMFTTNNTIPKNAIYKSTSTGRVRYTRANATAPIFFNSGGTASKCYLEVGNILWAPNAVSTANPTFNSTTVGRQISVTLNGSFNYTRNGSQTPTITLNSTVDTLFLAPNSSITIPTGLTLDFNSKDVILQSSSAGTASIATIQGNLSNAINVTTETFIPGGRRAFRFLGHPFTTTQAMSSLVDDIYVTGAGGGFDATATNSPSAFWFSNPSTWTAFTSTSDASWTQYRGIRVLVRGDRNQPTALTGGNPTPNPVTLDMTGTVNTGAQNIVLPAGYSVVGNPYPSPVNLGARLNATTNIGTQFWFWDANAGPTAGAYRTKVIGSAATIPMNGAFVVEPTAGTTIAFVEGDKVASDSSDLFRPSNTASGLVELQVLYNNYPADNLFVRFNNTATDNKESFDGGKLLNPEVNFYAISADNQKLSLDTRAFSNNKIIPLGFTATAANSFTIKVADYGITEEVYLKDKLLNIETKLDATTTYTFSVDPANATTVGNDRFELVFRTSAALPTNFVSVAAQQKGTAIEVSFATANEQNMHSYEVEESKDGASFTKGTTVEAKNAATNNYNWLDANIHNGNNYYRVKAIEKNGVVKYSQVVRVNVGKQSADITVYPNPVKGGIVNLQLTDIDKGIYTVKIYNNIGQEIANKQINHNGGSANQTISIGNVPTGKYNMLITNGTSTVTKTVVVE